MTLKIIFTPIYWATLISSEQALKSLHNVQMDFELHLENLLRIPRLGLSQGDVINSAIMPL